MPILDKIFRMPFSSDFFRFFWASATLMSGTCPTNTQHQADVSNGCSEAANCCTPTIIYRVQQHGVMPSDTQAQCEPTVLC